MRLLGEYQNGNYTVKIYNDGTKIRETNDDVFVASFPECIDLKITNNCDMGCPYCHEDSKLDGKHGDILNTKIIDTIRPFTELAIGGGNPLSHPDLILFLKTLKSKNIIANMTVNQNHFVSHQDLIRYLVKNDLIKGLGVSLVEVNNEFINTITQYPNAVIHIINGITTLNDFKKLYNHNLKILILGYKEIRRGKEYYSPKVEVTKNDIYKNINEIINGFKVVSFDNLAIKQLDLKRIFTQKDWDEFYMGDDGQYTMYIDLVEEEYALSSTSTQRFKLMDGVVDMFKVVKSL
jgi:organic radical activating enzyme